jgi:hypothetical protein
MDSKKLGYFYLPLLAVLLCLMASVLDLYVGRSIRIEVVILIPIMCVLLYLGYRNKI